MVKFPRITAGGLALAAAFAPAACKPKGAGADTKAVVDFDAGGNARTAFELLPLRNFTVAPLAAGAADAGALQADAMVRTRLFALIECGAVVGDKGDRLDAASLMSAVEARAAIDDLYVDEKRNLLTSLDDGKLAAFGSAANKLVRVPCRVFGRRLLSWDVLTDIQVRAAGLPAAPSAGDESVMSVYRLAQALHLSLRGNYAGEGADQFLPRVPSMMDMIYEQAGLTPSADALTSRLLAADAAYNVCSRAALPQGIPAVGALRAVDFRCVPHPSKPGVSVYAPGGASTYAQVRDRLALAIEGAHAAVFAKDERNDDDLAALWDLLTGTAVFPADASRRGQLGGYLATGKGLDFAATFAAAAPGAVHAAAARARINSNYLLAPLALGLPGDAGARVTLIQRANGPADAARPLLDGGQRNLTAKRASTAAGRIAQLGGYMGSGGKAGLGELAGQVRGAMATLRRPRD